MDVWRITVAALRRWYVLLPLLALTGIAVITAGNGVAPAYEARLSAMIMPQRAEGPVPNPYGDADQANAALGIVLDSVDSRTAINEQGLAATYEIGTQDRSTIFQVSIRADTPDVAEQTGVAVIDLARQELSTRQTDAGLPEAAQYTLAVLEPPAVISVVQTGKTRVQAIVGVLGAGVSLLVAVLFDDIVGLIRRFRAQRAEHAEEEAANPAEPASQPAEKQNLEPHESTSDSPVPTSDSRAEPEATADDEPRAEPEAARESDASAASGTRERDQSRRRSRRSRYEVARRP